VTNGELTRQRQDDDGFAVWITSDAAGDQRAVLLTGPVPEDEPLPEGVFHLLVADEDVAHRAQLRRTTLCGAEVQPNDLPSSYLGGQLNPRYCPECVSEAVRWSAAAGSAS
jgi:hypothetical protein